jgi:gamma-glutamyl-gamma-aminobutyrate hydrolase PuuD
VVVTPEHFTLQGMNGVDGIESVAIADVWDSERGFTSPIDGLFIYADESGALTPELSMIVKTAKEANVPILGSAAGMHLLNTALCGDVARATPGHTSDDQPRSGRKSIFLAPGAKVSSTIGGSGWLSINCDHDRGIAQKELAPGAMTAAIADDRIVEAFEMPGHRWIIGVQWDVFRANRLPRGFDNVWMAFNERVTGK